MPVALPWLHRGNPDGDGLKPFQSRIREGAVSAPALSLGSGRIVRGLPPVASPAWGHRLDPAGGIKKAAPSGTASIGSRS
jgi:hypothetical protein